nr:MAG TPA: excisionase [Caudoviricetes sp.]
MNNVINLNKSKIEIPNDLMTFKEVGLKYKIKYPTLYKYTKTLNEIPVYTRGGLKVSERDVIKWLNDGLEPARG